MNPPLATNPNERDATEDAPHLSVVVAVGKRRERIGRMLRALSDQSWNGAFEIVLVDTTDLDLDVDSPLQDVIRHVRAPAGTLPGRARHAGYRVSSGHLVAFLEDHCFPEPAWMESIVRRHLEPWAAVAYVFRNGSPDTYLSRSVLLAEYGHWLFPAEGGPASSLPGSNVAYKRVALEQYGDQLGQLLEADFHLHQALRGNGAAFFVEPGAVVQHESYRRFSELLISHLLFCRLQATRRVDARRWGAFRRLAAGLAVPALLPAVQVSRIFWSQQTTSRKRRLLLAFPILYCICQFDAIGEALGFLFGEGDAARRFARHEIDAERSKIDALY